MFVHVSQMYFTIVWLISCRNIIHTELRSFFSIIFSYLQCISLNFTLASLTLMTCFLLNHLCLENLFFYVQNTFLHYMLAFMIVKPVINLSNYVWLLLSQIVSCNISFCENYKIDKLRINLLYVYMYESDQLHNSR